MASKQPLEIFQIDTIGKRLASLERNDNNNNNFREQPSTLYVPQIDLAPKHASVDALRFIYCYFYVPNETQITEECTSLALISPCYFLLKGYSECILQVPLPLSFEILSFLSSCMVLSMLTLACERKRI